MGSCRLKVRMRAVVSRFLARGGCHPRDISFPYRSLIFLLCFQPIPFCNASSFSLVLFFSRNFRSKQVSDLQPFGRDFGIGNILSENPNFIKSSPKFQLRTDHNPSKIHALKSTLF